MPHFLKVYFEKMQKKRRFRAVFALKSSFLVEATGLEPDRATRNPFILKAFAKTAPKLLQISVLQIFKLFFDSKVSRRFLKPSLAIQPLPFNVSVGTFSFLPSQRRVRADRNAGGVPRESCRFAFRAPARARTRKNFFKKKYIL